MLETLVAQGFEALSKNAVYAINSIKLRMIADKIGCKYAINFLRQCNKHS